MLFRFRRADLRLMRFILAFGTAAERRKEQIWRYIERLLFAAAP